MMFGGVVYILLSDLLVWAFNLDIKDDWFGVAFDISCFLVAIFSALFFRRLLKKLWEPRNDNRR